MPCTAVLNYSSFNESARPSSGFRFAFSSVSANRWELPILLKYRFSGRFVRPFLAAGPAVSVVSGLHQEVDSGGRDISGHVGVSHLSLDGAPELAHSAAIGLMMGAETESRLGPVRLEPQFRYAVWPTHHFQDLDRFRSNSNDAVFLLGLIFSRHNPSTWLAVTPSTRRESRPRLKHRRLSDRGQN